MRPPTVARPKSHCARLRAMLAEETRSCGPAPVRGFRRQARGSRATAGCTELGVAFLEGTRLTTAGFSRDLSSCSRIPATAGDVEASAGEEYTRRAAPEHRGQLCRVGTVPIGSFTSKSPQRLQEYSYVAMKRLRCSARPAYG